MKYDKPMREQATTFTLHFKKIGDIKSCEMKRRYQIQLEFEKLESATSTWDGIVIAICIRNTY